MNKNKLVQQLATFGSLIILIIFFSITSSTFLSIDNFLSIALQTAVIGIVALGSTFVIITSGIDLSVGAIVAFSGVMMGFAMQAGMPTFISILIGLLSGVALGVAIGLFITKAKLPPFIVTLGFMMMVRGLVLALTNGMPISGLNDGFDKLAAGTILKIPYPVIFLVVLAVVLGFVLKNTKIGKYVYAIGSNEDASKLSGVNVDRVKLFVYGLSGLMCAISGIILASRLISAQPTEGMGYEMDAIAAVVIGGASLAGGTGTIFGTMLGAFIMTVLKNGLTMLNVSGMWQQVAVGAVVLGAVYIDNLKNKR